MVTITGGKLTTWRRMAKLAVDRIVERDGRDAPCRTHEIPLGMAVDAAGLPRVEGVPEEAYAQLAGRYGYAARDVLHARRRARRARPADPARATPTCSPRRSTPRGASRRARVGDVLLRRTRLGLTGARALCAPGEQAPERVAAALGEELGWDAARRAAEAAAFRAEAERRGHRGGGVVSAPERVLRAGGRRIDARRRAAADGHRQRDAGLVLRRRRAARRRGARGARARAGRGGRARSSTSAASRRSAAGRRSPADEEAARVVPVIERGRARARRARLRRHVQAGGRGGGDRGRRAHRQRRLRAARPRAGGGLRRHGRRRWC